jgi:mRNA interferase YafQ
MYTVKPTTKFQKDVKLAVKRGYEIDLLTEVIKELAAGKELLPKYHDHALSGIYQGCRECHITPDWLLIYKIVKNELYLYFIRTGTHSDLY